MPKAGATTDAPDDEGGKKPHFKKLQGRGRKEAADRILLYGYHAVANALANPKRRVFALNATEKAQERLAQSLLKDVKVRLADTKALSRLVGSEAVHQGLVLECAPLDLLDQSELFQLADARLILVLDEVMDPHNAGAILRSACAFGVDCVMITHRNSAPQGGVLAKSASGALDMVPIMAVRHLSKTLVNLKDMGFCTIGLDSEGPDILEDSLPRPARPTALIMGSEGDGLRAQTRDACQVLARLNMPGAIKSLNVSNAAALSLYILQQHLAAPNAGSIPDR